MRAILGLTANDRPIYAKAVINAEDRTITLEFHVYEGTQFRYKIICGTVPALTVLDKFFIEADEKYDKLSNPEDEDPDVRQAVLLKRG